MTTLPSPVRRVLVTGFGPFGDNMSNPSRVAAAAMAAWASDWVEFEELPVEYLGVAVWPRRADPSVFHLHLGLAASAKAVRVETVARNRCGATQDNAGLVGSAVIDVQAPENMRISWNPEPLRARLAELSAEPVELSSDCGDYVCNFTLYTSLLHAPGRALFIHLPPMDDDRARRWGRVLAHAMNPSRVTG